VITPEARRERRGKTCVAKQGEFYLTCTGSNQTERRVFLAAYRLEWFVIVNRTSKVPEAHSACGVVVLCCERAFGIELSAWECYVQLAALTLTWAHSA